MNNNNRLSAYKNLSIEQNVAIQVIDKATGQVVQEHIGHNSATNSLLFGIAHHLVGDFLPNETVGIHPSYPILANYVPRYISLGTMGLINQNQDSQGLPAGIGDTIPNSTDPEFIRLQELMNEAKATLDAAKEALAADCQYWPACDACAECNECATRIGDKRQAVEDAEVAYQAAYDAFMSYNEEVRFVEYMNHRPGYGADGYDGNENNGRKYLGLGYAFTSHDVTEQYYVNDIVTYNGILYECIADTKGPFVPSAWQQLDDSLQPSLGTTVKLELISPSFPREQISYRDIVPEYQSEIPKTIDVVFSAMISTGALKQFRPEGQDYIFITEAGLWSKRPWEDTSENGLLAGYRIIPPNTDNWDMTVPENREILKRQILKVGKNQVVQVVWKIQIGSIDKFDSDSPSPDLYTKVSFWLQGTDTQEMLPGSVFNISLDAAGTRIARDARTDRELIWATSDVHSDAYLRNGVYYLNQVIPPSGYLPSDQLAFEVVDGYINRISGPGIIDGRSIIILNEPAPNIPEVVFLSETGINTLQNIRQHEGNPYDTPFYPVFLQDDGFLYYYSYDGTILPVTLTRSGSTTVAQFKELATELETNEYDWPIYYCQGFYFTEAQSIGFSDNTNLNHVVAALADTAAIMSFRDFDTSRLTSLSHAFESLTYALSIDVTGWDTSNITDMSSAFKQANRLDYLNGIADWDVSNVTTMHSMFYSTGSGSLGRSVANVDLNNWNTSSLQVMDWMFNNSYVRPGANWNTSSVTSMKGVFSDIGNTSPSIKPQIYWLNWDTSNVTDMSFLYHNSIGSIYSYREDDVNYFGSWMYLILNPDTSNVTTMDYMFANNDLTAYNYTDASPDKNWLMLDGLGSQINGLDTSSVTSMASMFEDIAFTQNIDDAQSSIYLCTNWDTSNVTDMSSMFLRTRSGSWVDHTIIFDINGWNLTSLQDASNMFQLCPPNIGRSATFSGVEPSAILNISGMYKYCSNYADNPVKANTWDLSHLQYMNDTWRYNTLELLDLSDQDLSNLLEAHRFVEGFGVIDRTPVVKLPNTIDFSQCVITLTESNNFWGDLYLDDLKVHSSDIANLKVLFGSSVHAFNLDGWAFDGEGSTIDLSNLFSENVSMVIFNGTNWDVTDVDTFDYMFKRQYGDGLQDFSALDTWTGVSANASFVEMCYSSICNSPSEDREGTTYRAYEQGYSFPDWSSQIGDDWEWDTSGLYHVPYSGYLAWTFDTSDIPHGTTPGSGFGSLIPKAVTTAVSLTSAGIQTLQGAAAGNDSFIRIEDEVVNNSPTGNLVAYHPLYEDGVNDDQGHSYHSTPIDPFTDGPFEDMEDFYSNAITCATTDARHPLYYNSGYYYCEAPLEFSSNANFQAILTTLQSDAIDVSFHNWDASNLTSVASAFEDWSSLRSIDLTLTNTGNITDMSSAFKGTTNLIHLYGINNWDTSSVTNMSNLFTRLGAIGTAYAQPGAASQGKIDPDHVGVKIYNWDTSSVTNMNWMFSEAHINIPIHSWDTTSVTSMVGTFSNVVSNPASRYIDPNDSHIDPSTCEIIEWDTSAVTNMSQMFKDNGVYCTDSSTSRWCREYDVSSLDVSAVTNMSQMFKHCRAIRGDVSSWDVSSVTNMSGVFQQFNYPLSTDGSYSPTATITGLDSWSTSNVTDLSYAFADYNQEYDPQVGYEGYQHWSVSNVTDMSYMFYQSSASNNFAVQQLGSYVLNSQNVEHIDYMFYNCDLATYWLADIGDTLEVEWNTYSLLTASYAFYNTRVSSNISFDPVYLLNCTNVAGIFCNMHCDDFENSYIGPAQIAWDNLTEPAASAYAVQFKEVSIPGIQVSTASGVARLKEAFQYESATDTTGGFPHMMSLIAPNWKFSGTATDLSGLFSSCQYLQTIDLSGWDVSTITNFNRMFYKKRRYVDPAIESAADTIYDSGILDFSSLDDWQNVSPSATFVEMCRTNLYDADNSISPDGSVSFEDSYTFPAWADGHWTYTGLVPEDVTSSHLSYYYQAAGDTAYTAYCFGTYHSEGGSTDTDLRMINHPVAGFGTFVPEGSQLLYDWDFTDSLYDDVNSIPATFFSDVDDPTSATVVPGVNQFEVGVGLHMANQPALHIPVDLFSQVNSYAVEIDFADCTLPWASWNSGFLSNVSPTHAIDQYKLVSGFTSDAGVFSIDTCNGSGASHSSDSAINVNTYFANSTLKIVTKITADNVVYWELYRNGVKFLTTDEYMSDGVTPVFWDNSSLNYPFVISGISGEMSGTITGLRVYGQVNPEPRTLEHEYLFTSADPFVDTVTGISASVSPTVSTGTSLTIDSTGVTKIFEATPDPNPWRGVFSTINNAYPCEIEIEFGNCNCTVNETYSSAHLIRIEKPNAWAYYSVVDNDLWHWSKVGDSSYYGTIYGLNRVNLSNSTLTIRLKDGNMQFKRNGVVLCTLFSLYTVQSGSVNIWISLDTTGRGNENYYVNVKSVRAYRLN